MFVAALLLTDPNSEECDGALPKSSKIGEINEDNNRSGAVLLEETAREDPP